MLKSEKKIYTKKFFKDYVINQKKMYKDDFTRVDFDELVKISSSNLMLPTLYLNLKKRGDLSLLPTDLKNYLEQIHKLNYKRNEILLDEITSLSKILNENDIQHVFIKGSSYLISNVYSDIGARMIGDIDFLIYKKNHKKCEKVLYENGFKDLVNFSFIETRHLIRKVSSDKNFAIEPHISLFNKENEVLRSQEILDRMLKINGVNVPNFKDQYLYNILFNQINDHGQISLNISYRNIYDTIQLWKMFNEEIKINKYINVYFTVLKELKINFYKEIKFKNDFITSFRIKLKKTKFDKLDYLISKVFIKFPLIIRQMNLFFLNSKYRTYIFKKFCL